MENQKIEELRGKLKSIQDKEQSQKYQAELAQRLKEELDGMKEHHVNESTEQAMNVLIEQVGVGEKELVENELATEVRDLYEQVETEMTKCQEEISKKKQEIETIKQEREEMQQEVTDLNDAIKVHKKLVKEIDDNVKKNLKLGKPAADAYTSSKAALKKSISQLNTNKKNRTASINEKKDTIEQLTAEIGDLESNYTELAAIFAEVQELEGRQSGREEDLMWEEYRNDDSVETKKQQEIDEAFEQKHNEELAEEERIRKGTEFELGMYEEELAKQEQQNKEEVKQEPVVEQYEEDDDERDFGKWLEKHKTVDAEVPIKIQRAQGRPRDVIPVVTAPRENTKKEQKPEKEKEKPKTTYQWANAGLKILESGKPVYYVDFITPTGYKSSYIAPVYEKMEVVTSERKKLLKEYNIDSKYIDVGLVKTLREADASYGTKTAREYLNLMIKKEPQTDPKIDYDFSNLYQIPENKEQKRKLNYLKKVANANYNAILASYEKAPNIFQRLWKKITTKLLPKRSSETVEPTMEENYENKKYTYTDLVEAQLRNNLTDKSYDEVIKTLRSEPGFSVEVAEEQIKNSERNEEEKEEALAAIGKGKRFRSSIAVDDLIQTVQNLPESDRDITEVVQEIMNADEQTNSDELDK